ncbi:hypothetical protein IQ07DRAFT_269902 [Pyrenochaeta sp. DS3sAY3a]|nr:hypothetical protein IQ07DRAFT_269902 [Pyrenochaeta sp. DS3sAY3a]
MHNLPISTPPSQHDSGLLIFGWSFTGLALAFLRTEVLHKLVAHSPYSLRHVARLNLFVLVMTAIKMRNSCAHFWLSSGVFSCF